MRSYRTRAPVMLGRAAAHFAHSPCGARAQLGPARKHRLRIGDFPVQLGYCSAPRADTALKKGRRLLPKAGNKHQLLVFMCRKMFFLRGGREKL